MLGSYHSLWHKFGNLHCGISQQMQLQVFEGSVPQEASFGREVWAPVRLGKAHAQKRTQDYPAGSASGPGPLYCLRKGARPRTRQPLVRSAWWRQVLHFWEQSSRPTEEVRGLSGAQTRNYRCMQAQSAQLGICSTRWVEQARLRFSA